MSVLDADIESVVVSAEQIRAKTSELAAAIDIDYADREPLLVGVLKGAAVFMSDLARSLERPSTMEFMAVSSYGSSTTSSGVVRILKDLDRSIEGEHILVVEDIIDSGLTLSWLIRNLSAHAAPHRSRSCALLRKPDAAKAAMVEVRLHRLRHRRTSSSSATASTYGERYRDIALRRQTSTGCGLRRADHRTAAVARGANYGRGRSRNDDGRPVTFEHSTRTFQASSVRASGALACVT